MKKRIKLSQAQKDAILFEFDKSCCICKDRNKSVQIHHIDGNPANNDLDNLAVLCLEHHDEAHIKGGLGAQTSPGLIKKYRDEWLGIVSIQREKHYQASPEVLSNSYMNSFLDTLACHEIIKQGHKILQADWEDKVLLLDDLNIYTSHEYGILPKAKIIDLLYSLATKTRFKMPVEVASIIEHLVLSSLPVMSLVRPELEPPSKQQTDVLESANLVGSTMAYDGIKRLKNIKIVASGAEIMSTVLRYAKLNSLDDLGQRFTEEFRRLIELASEVGFSDAQKWISFMQEDALAIGDDAASPAMLNDIVKQILES